MSEPKFKPGMKVTYTPEARRAWIDAEVVTPLPTGDGTVVATPRPYVSVPGMAYVVWDSLPGKWTLTDERALMQVTLQVEMERPVNILKVYEGMRWAMGGTEEFTDAKLNERLIHDLKVLVAHGHNVDEEKLLEEWDELAIRLHMYLGGEERA